MALPNPVRRSPVRRPSQAHSRPQQPESDGGRRLAWAGTALFCALLLTAVVILNQRFGGTAWTGLQLRQAERPAPLPKLPWVPLLSEEERLRGMSYYGGGARLRAVAAKLAAGQHIKAVTLGGSVTYGHGVDDLRLSYPALLFSFINASWPHRDHVLLNRGMPGSTAPVTTPCAAALLGLQPASPGQEGSRQQRSTATSPLPTMPDLVVVEFTTNESPAAYTSHGRQAYEALVRQLLALPSRPAVVLLHHYAWWKAEGDGASAGLFYREPEGQLATYSQYYDVPSVSLRAAAWRLMQAGVKGFKVDKALLAGNRNSATGEEIPAAEPGAERDYLYLDTIHPGPAGHQVLAELVAGLLQRAAAELAAGLVPAQRRDARVAGLPPPMAPNYEEQRASLCLQLREFKAAVRRQRGFEYRPEKPQLERWIEQKWGWSALEPGSWAELEVDTRLRGAAGAGAAARPPGRGGGTRVLLSHLRSYSGMGTALVECLSGCQCEPNVLDGTTASRVSVFKVHSFKATQHGRCRFRVTVRQEPGEVPSEGHKVMLAAVAVTHRVQA